MIAAHGIPGRPSPCLRTPTSTFAPLLLLVVPVLLVTDIALDACVPSPAVCPSTTTPTRATLLRRCGYPTSLSPFVLLASCSCHRCLHLSAQVRQRLHHQNQYGFNRPGNGMASTVPGQTSCLPWALPPRSSISHLPLPYPRRGLLGPAVAHQAQAVSYSCLYTLRFLI